MTLRPFSPHPYPTMPLAEVRVLMEHCHIQARHYYAAGDNAAGDRYARRSQLALARAMELEMPHDHIQY